MGKKRHTPEEIISKLRQVDVLVAQGTPVADAIRAIGVTEVTYYRWRQEYGGLKSDQIKRMKALETENQRLRKAIADLTLDKLILQEAARGNLPIGAKIDPGRDIGCEVCAFAVRWRGADEPGGLGRRCWPQGDAGHREWADDDAKQHHQHGLLHGPK